MIAACWKRDLTSQISAGDSTPARVLPLGVLGASAVHSNCRVLEKHFMIGGNRREPHREPSAASLFIGCRATLARLRKLH